MFPKKYFFQKLKNGNHISNKKRASVSSNTDILCVERERICAYAPRVPWRRREEAKKRMNANLVEEAMLGFFW